jgi:DNA-binding transcriptional LysR family regulator
MSWLTPQLGEFYRLHPQIGLKVLAEFHALDAAKMKSNGLAAALRFDLGEYHDLVAHQILDEFLVPVATPRFLAEHPGIRSPGDLEGHYLLHDSESWSGAKASTEWEHWLEGAKVNIAPASMKLGHQFNLSILATAATVADQGIGMGRLSLVLNDLMTGRLCAPFPLYIRSRASYHFVTSSRSPPEVEIVRTWILGRVQEFQRARDTFLARMTQLPY